jgi:hypothetical protein
MNNLEYAAFFFDDVVYLTHFRREGIRVIWTFKGQCLRAQGFDSEIGFTQYCRASVSGPDQVHQQIYLYKKDNVFYAWHREVVMTMDDVSIEIFNREGDGKMVKIYFQRGLPVPTVVIEQKTAPSQESIKKALESEDDLPKFPTNEVNEVNEELTCICCGYPILSGQRIPGEHIHIVYRDDFKEPDDKSWVAGDLLKAVQKGLDDVDIGKKAVVCAYGFYDSTGEHHYVYVTNSRALCHNEEVSFPCQKSPFEVHSSA